MSKAGSECAFYVGREFYGAEKVFTDRGGIRTNYHLVREGGGEYFHPYQVMFESLTELTGKPLYHYRAYELLVTLDLEVYKAVRRLIVPADIEFSQLHKVLQDVFSWGNQHLHEFSLYDDRSGELITMLVRLRTLGCSPQSSLAGRLRLVRFFPKYKSIVYTYDMGDNWEHDIELVRVIEDYEQESPYLLEASGQAPPENIGGVPNYLDFRGIMLNPKHPRHKEAREWAVHWNLELPDWKKRPRPICV